MLVQKIPLRDEDPAIYLDAYIADILPQYKRKAILVIPGGGYGGVCADREGEPIAQAFVAKGYDAFVLHYSVGRSRPYPAQLVEASMAIKYIRDNAETYGIDADNVFAVGFSAGGHLTGSLATMWHHKEVYEQIAMPYGYNKPTGAMMIYPVVNATEVFAHNASIKNLLCTDTPTAEQLEMCSVDLQVDENTVPIFLMHTANDPEVNVQNSLCLATRLAEQKIPFELHIYPDAPHGVALANAITECGVPAWNNATVSSWVDQAATWAESVAATTKEA